jgi:23S rRNA (guanine2445-N2)-methyltransferase / 23S rRNA (guanine2069-N7)-methyltransferase
MPGVFRRLPTWSFFVLTARRDFEKVFGQRADRRRKLFNGDLECTYFQFLGPRRGKEESPKPVFGGIDDRARRQAEIFANRLKKRAHHLRKWPSKRGTDVYRLYDRDIKEVPLALDRYGDCLRLVPASDPLLSRTRAENEDWIDLMARTASETLGVPLQNVFIAGRPSEPRALRVTEDGLRYHVSLSGEHEIGFDPALRGLRQRLREDASGKHVLLVGPGGRAFRLAAESGGARSTHEIETVERMGRGTFDLAAIEVANLEGHVPLLKVVASRMASSGIAYLVTRSPRPKLAVEALSDWGVEEVTADTLPEEFRQKNHRVWRLVFNARRTLGPRDDGMIMA